MLSTRVENLLEPLIIVGREHTCMLTRLYVAKTKQCPWTCLLRGSGRKTSKLSLKKRHTICMHAYRTCAECSEAETCENIAPYRKGYGLALALQSLRQNGIGKYAEEMQREVDKGYSYT